jgi:hypothetical protein
MNEENLQIKYDNKNQIQQDKIMFKSGEITRTNKDSTFYNDDHIHNLKKFNK